MNPANSQSQTCFAPGPRATLDEVERQYSLVSRLAFVPELLNAQPNMVAILNENRQIVFANRTWFSTLDISDIHDILGKRPGEAMGCPHSEEGPAGCGTSEACSVCGAINVYLQAQKWKKAAASECRITATQGQKQISFDLLIWVTPFVVQDETFSILVASDISHEKRRRSLERIFFHDLANTVVALQGYTELLKRKHNKHAPDLAGSVHRVCKRLVREIDGQRQLLAAENQELPVKPQSLESAYLLAQTAQQFEFQEVGADRTIVIDPNMENITLSADPSLLSRTLDNLVKNALEASSPGETVTLGCRRTGNQIEFWVHNPQVMSKKVQFEIFNRSFSTKGSGRGLGTYSAKLLSERYMGGSLTFTSDQDGGTVFRLRLPLSATKDDLYVNQGAVREQATCSGAN